MTLIVRNVVVSELVPVLGFAELELIPKVLYECPLIVWIIPPIFTEFVRLLSAVPS